MTPLEWALDYAQIKMPVFPCDPISKRPLTRNGFKDATIDQERIEKWWKRNPTSMIGCPTGLITHSFVLDINPPYGVSLESALERIQKHVGEAGATETLTVRTPNGLHLWYLMPKDVVIRNRGKLLDGAIDCVRGEGGYVIMPGSVNKLGQEYYYVARTAQQKFPKSALIELVRPV